MNKCKIVEDLLPLYIEDLTSEETGNFVKEHLAECESCAAMHRRMSVPVQNEEPPKINYKKSLRLNVLKMVGQVLLTLALIAGALVYYQWEKGYFPVVKTISSPDGARKLELVDAGGIFRTRDGVVLKFTYRTGTGTFVNRYETDWSNLDVRWAPDGRTMVLFSENLEGENGIHILTQEEDPVSGGTKEIPGLYPAMEEPDLAARMRELLLTAPEFQNRELGEVKFAFDMWSLDSQRLYFTFTTDNGYGGRIRFDCTTREFTLQKSYVIQNREHRIPLDVLRDMIERAEQEKEEIEGFIAVIERPGESS